MVDGGRNLLNARPREGGTARSLWVEFTAGRELEPSGMAGAFFL